MKNRLYAVFKRISTCLSNLTYNLEAKCIYTLFILIEFKREYVYESLCNCTVIKQDHNAEKVLSV